MSVSDFEFQEKLGEGSFSTVYKVKRRTDDTVYALKIVRVSHLTDKEKENALTEIRVLASISHPNIISFKESFVEENCLYIVMDLANSGDLANKIAQHRKNQTRFRESEIWSVLYQTSLGLKVLHGLNIVHRDIKSANLFISDNTIKIADLNVCKVLKKSFAYTQTGTPYYASPEIWKGMGYDTKIDVWSLGCVIYEMATLTVPFKGSDMKSLHKKIAKGNYSPIPTYYSEELIDAVRLMLAVNPAKRPNINTILSQSIAWVNNNNNTRGNSSALMKTIEFPRNFQNLPDILPPSKYGEVSPIPNAQICYEVPSRKVHRSRKSVGGYHHRSSDEKYKVICRSKSSRHTKILPDSINGKVKILKVDKETTRHLPSLRKLVVPAGKIIFY